MSTVITTIAASDLITNSRTDINNNFSSLNTNKIETSVIDTDTALAANSDAKLASQKAVKAYVDALGSLTTKTSGVSAGPSASATQTITHSLGRVPTVIRVTSYGGLAGGTSSQKTGSSSGTYTSSGNRCVYMIATKSTDNANAATSTTFAIYISGINNVPAEIHASGVIQNVTSSSFDIVWTVGSDVSSVGAFLWEAN